MKNKNRKLTIAGILTISVLAGTANAQSTGVFPGVPAYKPNTLIADQQSGAYWRDAQAALIERAINPDDYICSAPTDLDLWVNNAFFSIDALSADILLGLGVIYWAGDSKALFDNDDSDEYIGVNGEYTHEQIKRHKDNQRFWDVPVDDVLLQGMHGADIANDEIMAPFIDWAFGMPPPITDYIIDTAQNTIAGGIVDIGPLIGQPPGIFIFDMPGIPGGYDNPLLTLNAFALSTEGNAIPGVGVPADKIVMGDGLLEGMAAIGLNDIAPDFVHAHEFAHHVQFEVGAFMPGPPTPEGTRRTELMADAFAAYYSSHARGATFNEKRFVDVMASAFGVGDCSFGNPNHHGTHLQRERAAAWGGDFADAEQKKGHITSAYDMLFLFDAALPVLVAPDAP
jgi:hypothetical protein